jgi:hypothetical protein
MKFDPFSNPKELLELLKEDKSGICRSGFYPLSVRRCGNDLYIFFAPTFRPIGISSMSDAKYCSEILEQDILYAGTRRRADLLREVYVLKISKRMTHNETFIETYVGTAENKLSNATDSVLRLLQEIGNFDKKDWVEYIRFELTHFRDFNTISRNCSYHGCALFKSIDQLHDLMDIGPGKHFFLKVSSPYLFSSIADDFYDEERGEEYDLTEDDEFGDLIRRGRKAETGACPADFYSAPPDQGAVGKKPADYFMRMPSADQPDPVCLAKIPHRGMAKLTRDQVRAIARDSSIPPLAAYACIMAWGGQRMNHFVSSLDTSTRIRRLVEYLRDSSRDRAQDFDYVTG